ncbi:MAG: hypothetical protein R3E53_18605 [Myxococcota bacterium]
MGRDRRPSPSRRGRQDLARRQEPDLDPIAKPGAIADFLRGNPDGTSMMKALREREPLPDYYMDRDARIKKMDEQGIEAMWLFPTLGVLYEERSRRTREAVKTLFHAFNRWVVERTGASPTRTASSARPTSPSATSHFACAELERALKEGARVACMRPSAIHTPDGVFALAHALRSLLGAGLRGTGITVVIHTPATPATVHGYVNDGFTADAGAAMHPEHQALQHRAGRLRFPDHPSPSSALRALPRRTDRVDRERRRVPPDLFRKLRQSRDRLKIANYYKEDPGLLFKEHVWINPSGRTTSTRSSIYGADRHLRLRLAAYRGHAQPSTTSRSSRSSTTRRSRRSCVTTRVR